MNKKSLVILFAVFSYVLSAQSWLPAEDSLLYGGMINGLVKTSDGIITGTSKGIYKKLDGSQTWVQKNVGIDSNKLSINSLTRLNSALFFSSFGGYNITALYRSDDEGETWTEVTPNGLPSSSPWYWLGSWNNYLYTTVSTTTYLSTDGYIWTASAIPFIQPLNDTLASISVSGTYITYLNVQNTLDTLLPVLPGGGEIFSSSTALFAIQDTNVYRVDLGADPLSWQLVSQINYPGFNLFQQSTYYSSGDNIFMIKGAYNSSTFSGFYNKVFLSHDNGDSWQLLSDSCGLPSFDLERFYSLQGDTIYANAMDSRLYCSVDGGDTWTDASKGILTYDVGRIIKTNNAIIIKPVINGQVEIGLLRSTDNGLTWQSAMNGIPPTELISDTTFTTPARGFPFSIGDSIYYYGMDSNTLYKSFDEGFSWQAFPGFPFSTPDQYLLAYIGGDENSSFFAYNAGFDSVGTQIVKVFRSEDNCNTWQTIPSIDSLGTTTEDFPISVVGQRDTMLFVKVSFTSAPLFYSTTNGNTWTEIPMPNASRAVDYYVSTGIGTSYIYDFSSVSTAFMASLQCSSDTVNPSNATITDSLFWWENGTWSKIEHQGLPAGINILSLRFITNTWYITSDMGVYESTDDGLTWNVNSSRLNNGGGAGSVASANSQLMGKLSTNLEKLNNNATMIRIENDGIWYFDPNAVIGIETTNDRIGTGILVYPNPSSTQITLSEEGTKDLSYYIYDYLGHVCKSGTLTAGTTTIPVHNLNTGIYILKLSDNRHVKFIVAN